MISAVRIENAGVGVSVSVCVDVGGGVAVGVSLGRVVTVLVNVGSSVGDDVVEGGGVCEASGVYEGLGCADAPWGRNKDAVRPAPTMKAAPNKIVSNCPTGIPTTGANKAGILDQNAMNGLCVA